MANSFEKELKAKAITIATDELFTVAKELKQDLEGSAKKHKRTGELARNIKLTKKGGSKDITFVVDGGIRSQYTNNSYHPMFFLHDKQGKIELTNALLKARKKLK